MHTTRRLATVLGFSSVGMLIAVWLHDYTVEVVRQNDELRAMNTELINNQYTYMKCLPDVNSKAIIQRVNGSMTCEIHTNKTWGGA